MSSRSNEAGFALLVMFGLMASASVGLLIAVQVFAPPMADARVRVDTGLATTELAARDSFRCTGAFPADVSGLIAHSAGLNSPTWLADPWGAGQDLACDQVSAALRVRSRGADGSLGTADDLGTIVPPEQSVRVRQRSRLRLIRAVFVRSQYRYTPAMEGAGGADWQSMLTAMRGHAIARRLYLTSDAATRVVLQQQMDAFAATVASLASAHGCPSLPPAVTGAGGLMSQLGLHDGKAVDGAGASLLAETTLGVSARGSDGTGGTDDDM